MIKTRKYSSKSLALINKSIIERENNTEITCLRHLYREKVYYIGKLKERTLNEFIFDDGLTLERNIFAKVFN